MPPPYDKVILTIPHAMCPIIYSGHPCDTIAPEAAKIVEDEYLRYDTGEARVLIADVVRTVMDYNRFESRDSRFRTKLRNTVQQSRLEEVMVLDVHSFPPDLGFFFDLEVAILEDEQRPTSYTVSLLNYLISRGVSAGALASAPGKNDITFEMRNELFVEAILIEFNEGLLTRGRLGLVAKYVGEWLRSIQMGASALAGEDAFADVDD